MRRGKHSIPRSRAVRIRLLPVLLAALIAVLLAGGTTVAALVVRSAAVENTFVAGNAPTPMVMESFDGAVKQHVYVALDDDGDAACYVRAAVLIAFADDDGHTVAAVPVEGTDYTITYGSGWTKNGNYWYYTAPVDPGAVTSDLITECVTLNESMHLTVNVLAQTIQAYPASAVENAWGFVPAAQ